MNHCEVSQMPINLVVRLKFPNVHWFYRVQRNYNNICARARMHNVQYSLQPTPILMPLCDCLCAFSAYVTKT